MRRQADDRSVTGIRLSLTRKRCRDLGAAADDARADASESRGEGDVVAPAVSVPWIAGIAEHPDLGRGGRSNAEVELEVEAALACRLALPERSMIRTRSAASGHRQRAREAARS